MLPLSYFPDSSVQHTDWEVAPITRFTFAGGVAGTGAVFSFRNGSCVTDPVYGGLTYDMLFIGVGAGVDIQAKKFLDEKRLSRRGRVAYSKIGTLSNAISHSALWISMDPLGGSLLLHWWLSILCSFPLAILVGAYSAVSRLPDLESVWEEL